jgi:polysaccharide pyruvyl transferase WcaK-like protein
MAHLFSKPTLLYAIGVESITGSFWPKALKKILGLSGLEITVRDAESKVYLVRLGLKSENIRVVADPVFSTVDGLAPRNGTNGAPPKVIFIPRFPCPSSGYDLYRLILSTLKGKNVFLSGFLFQPVLEQGLVDLSQFSIPFPDASSPIESVRIVTGHNFVVSARFHGLVLAALSGRPFIGLGEADKVERICSWFKMPYLPWSAEPDEINAAVEKMLQGRLSIDPERVQELRGSADLMVEPLKKVMI